MERKVAQPTERMFKGGYLLLSFLFQPGRGKAEVLPVSVISEALVAIIGVCLLHTQGFFHCSLHWQNNCTAFQNTLISFKVSFIGKGTCISMAKHDFWADR